MLTWGKAGWRAQGNSTVFATVCKSEMLFMKLWLRMWYQSTRSNYRANHDSIQLRICDGGPALGRVGVERNERWLKIGVVRKSFIWEGTWLAPWKEVWRWVGQTEGLFSVQGQQGERPEEGMQMACVGEVGWVMCAFLLEISVKESWTAVRKTESRGSFRPGRGVWSECGGWCRDRSSCSRKWLSEMLYMWHWWHSIQDGWSWERWR